MPSQQRSPRFRARAIAATMAATIVLAGIGAAPCAGAPAKHWWSHHWQNIRRNMGLPTPKPTAQKNVQREQANRVTRADSNANPASGLPTLPDDDITFAQMNDSRTLDLDRSGGRVGFVWGSLSPSSGGLGSRYYPIDRDLDRSHTAEWYATNASDQILYKCDQTTPASLYTYSWGSYSPIDISNPAVRQYVLNKYIGPALDSGYKVIALDNVSLRNDGKRCGIYRNGKWVQLYTGAPYDTAFSSAVLDYVGWLAGEIHARGGMLALNAKVDATNPELTRKLIALGDIWLEEAGNSRGCTARIADDLWRTRFALSRWAGQNMGWVSLEKTCATPDELGDDESQWIVGNFLLSRGPHSYLGAVKDGVPATTLRYPASLNPRVGAATGPAYEVPGGGWARTFSRGIVVVNPSSTGTLNFALPDGSWQDIGSAPLSGTITLPPTSARVILRADR